MSDPDEIATTPDPDNTTEKGVELECTFCGKPIEDDQEVRWRPGEYIRHIWCHARARNP